MPSSSIINLVNPKPHAQRHSIFFYRDVPRPNLPFGSNDHFRDITARSPAWRDSYDGFDRGRWRGCYAFVSCSIVDSVRSLMIVWSGLYLTM